MRYARTRTCTRFPLLRSAIAIAVLGGPLATWAVATAPSPPVRIEIPSDPPARETRHLVEQWRVGGDDEDILLGVITDAARDADGLVYLLDTQLSQVVVLGPDGTFRGTLSRQGEGPGEVDRPNGLCVLDDGRIGIVQGFPGEVVLVSPDDTPAGTIDFGGGEAGGFAFLRGLEYRADRLLASCARSTFDREAGTMTGVRRLTLNALDGTELAVFSESTITRSFDPMVFDEREEFDAGAPDRSCLGPEGRIYWAPDRDRYEIRVLAADGAVLEEWDRPFTARTRNQDDKDEVGADMRIVIDGRRVEIERKVLDLDPAIESLQVAADGTLWVSNCYNRAAELPAGILARYDVFSPRGEFLEEVLLSAPDGNREQDGVLFLDGRHFLLIRNLEAAARSLRAGFGSDADADEAEDATLAAEPLEVVLYTVAAD